MKATLIDPKTRTVSDMELPDKITLDEIYKIIGDGCEMVEVVRLPGGNNDGMYVNEEGMLKLEYDDEGNCTSDFFMLRNPGHAPAHIIVGRGLILGCDKEGNEQSTDLSAEVMRGFVMWLKPGAKNKVAEMVGELGEKATCVCATEVELLDAGRRFYAELEKMSDNFEDAQ